MSTFNANQHCTRVKTLLTISKFKMPEWLIDEQDYFDKSRIFPLLSKHKTKQNKSKSKNKTKQKTKTNKQNNKYNSLK